MTRQQVTRTNQQSLSETPLVSGILQRAAVRSVPENEVQPTEEVEASNFRESRFHHDFSQVPVHTGAMPVIQGKLKEEVQQQGDRLHGSQPQAATALERDASREGELEAPGDRINASGEHQENKTGLPDRLKAGIEGLSGMSMDDVKVHYNSSKPSQIQALAYTQGTDIHLDPGQEKHLPHEAWHVVQQRQGRVKPTMQAKGVAINDDRGLEEEADIIGTRAAQGGFGHTKNSENSFYFSSPPSQSVQGYFKHRTQPLTEDSLEIEAVSAYLEKKKDKAKIKAFSKAVRSTLYEGTLSTWLQLNKLPTVAQILQVQEKKSESERDESSDEEEMSSEEEEMSGEEAVNFLVDWMIEEDFGVDNNFTVGVVDNGDLIIAKVNGIGIEADYSQRLKQKIIKSGINKTKNIWVAQKFNSAVGSNHAEMCVLAAAKPNKITYMKCTGPNCPFCGLTLQDYRLKNGNTGRGKVQQGWAHPFIPLSYGTQVGGTEKQQLDELNAFYEAKNDISIIKIGHKGISKPKTGNKKILCKKGET